MVAGLRLGLLAALVCLCAAGLSVAAPPQDDLLLADDGAVRSERSTNLSHITGSLRKIQMYVKNWHLQILPDGTVNGTSVDTTDYTILQRTTVNIGQVKIQGVSTCQYLCMDSCGLLYGTKEFNDECVFNEMIEQHNYNTYSSARYSSSRRTMYLALNRRGQPRKVQVRAQQQLGKLSTYARVLTKWVSVERVEELLARLGHHPLRHHQHVCAAAAAASTPPPDPASGDRLRCRKRKKRKKKRRRCPDNPELPCASAKNKLKPAVLAKRRKLCEQDSSRKICQRLVKSDNRQNKKKNIKKQLNAKKKSNNKDKKTMRNNNKNSVKQVLAVLNATSAASEESTTWLSYGDEEYSSTTEASLEDSEPASEQDEDLGEPADAASTASAPGLESETD